MNDQEKVIYAFEKLRKKLINYPSLKIICYGDSITYGYAPFSGNKVELSYPENLQMLLRKKRSGKTTIVYNEGIPGWTSENGELYLDQKVLKKQPDIVILMFGINDSLQRMGTQRYRGKLKNIIHTLKENKIDVILATPTPIYSWQNMILKKYATEAKETALEEEIPYIDLFAYYMSHYTNKDRKALLPDTVHFDPEKYPEIGEIIYHYLIDSDLEEDLI